MIRAASTDLINYRRPHTAEVVIQLWLIYLRMISQTRLDNGIIVFQIYYMI